MNAVDNARRPQPQPRQQQRPRQRRECAEGQVRRPSNGRCINIRNINLDNPSLAERLVRSGEITDPVDIERVHRGKIDRLRAKRERNRRRRQEQAEEEAERLERRRQEQVQQRAERRRRRRRVETMDYLEWIETRREYMSDDEQKAHDDGDFNSFRQNFRIYLEDLVTLVPSYLDPQSHRTLIVEYLDGMIDDSRLRAETLLRIVRQYIYNNNNLNEEDKLNIIYRIVAQELIVRTKRNPLSPKEFKLLRNLMYQGVEMIAASEDAIIPKQSDYDNDDDDTSKCPYTYLKSDRNCDGKLDPITYEKIPKNCGVCSGKQCYAVDTFTKVRDPILHFEDPMTRRQFTPLETSRIYNKCLKKGDGNWECNVNDIS